MISRAIVHVIFSALLALTIILQTSTTSDAQTVIATIGVGANPQGVAVNPNTNRIYVANHDNNNVSVIDGNTNSVITTIGVDVGPQGVAVNPTTNRIYVANNGSGDVSVIDGNTNSVFTTLSVGGHPFNVAVNSSTNRIYAAINDPNSVAVIDGASNTVVATLPNVGGGIAEVAANPTSNRVYVGNPKANTVAVVQDQPAPPPPPPPPAVSTWFFAEGATQPPFDTWFLIENPTGQTASVTFTFFLQPTGTVVQNYAVGPTSRFSLFANQALPNQAFSTRIDSNVAVFAERAMYVSYDGDVVTGIPATNKTWLFAEGATTPPFHTWLLLQNPNNVPATTTITYLLESGQTPTQSLTLPPDSRTSIFVNQVLPNAAFSSRVDSNQPIIAERAMYRFPGNAATVNSGVNAPSQDWFFSEGRTSFRGLRADTFLLLENTNTSQVNATITLFATDGRTTTFNATLAPTSRQTIFLNRFFSGSFGIWVNATAPIIAERSVFFGNEPLLGAYSTQGATSLITSWHFAEGETRAPFNELITILNPHGQSMDVEIDFFLETRQVVPAFFKISANSKLEVDVGKIVTGANSANVSTSLPSVAERTMYIFKQGSIGAHDTIGFPGS